MISTVSTIDKKNRHWAFVGLAVLISMLLIRGYQMQDEPWLITVPLWDLQNTHRLKEWLVAIFASSAIQLTLYLSLGFLAALSFGSQQSQGVSRITHLYATVFGAILSIAVSAIASVGLKPNMLDVIMPTGGCFVGAWIGVNWAAGGRARKLLWLKLMVLFGALVLVAVLLVQLVIDKVPSGFAAESLKSEDRTRLVKLLRGKSPLHVPENETVTLKLSEHDVNLLLTWGLSLGSSERKARISLDKSLAIVNVSIGFPFSDSSWRYVNFSIAGWLSIKSGKLNGKIKQLTIGSVAVPSFLLQSLSSAIISQLANEPSLEPVFSQIVSTEINRNYASVTYQKIDMPKGFRDKIFASIGPTEAMRDSLTAQFNMIRQVGDSFPSGSEVDLGVFMRPAFILAYQRSENGDPVLENRAAIIALSIAIGHRVLARFISEMPYSAVPSLKHRITLYQRMDWSQHFLISAALEVMSSESISLDIGLLKEELDSGKGGSGFSFADLAADRSGTMFAKIATSNKEAAELIQLRIVQSFLMGDYVPLISDLPEGIPDEQLMSEYGGAHGKKYQMILREIDRRIAHCDAYR